MRLEIYRINPARDKNRMFDRNLDEWKNGNVDSSIYDRVFEGNIEYEDFNNIESVISAFKCPNKPKDIHGVAYAEQRIETSDVVLFGDDYYYVSGEGTPKIRFSAEQAQTVEPEIKRYKTILVRPLRPAEIASLTPEEIGKAAGKICQYMFLGGTCYIIYNNAALAENRPLCRALYEKGRYRKLTSDQMKYFMYGYGFAKNGGRISASLVIAKDKTAGTYYYSEKQRTFTVYGDSPLFDLKNPGSELYVKYKGEERTVPYSKSPNGEFLDGRYRIEMWRFDCAPRITNIIAGDFVIVGFEDVAKKTLRDLTGEEIKKFLKRFQKPERYEMTESGFKAIPIAG